MRLEELSEQHGKLKSTNSQLKTENEGNAVRIKELELQLKDALHIKVQLQAQVDTLNPEKFELQQRLRSTEMDLQVCIARNSAIVASCFLRNTTVTHLF